MNDYSDDQVKGLFLLTLKELNLKKEYSKLKKKKNWTYKGDYMKIAMREATRQNNSCAINALQTVSYFG